MAEYDVVVRGARVFDGMGNPFAYKDVAIKDGRVCRVERHVAEGGHREIDATGLAIAPGFIDLHSHGDLAVLTCPDAPNYISQGVTTTVCGNCGLSAAPLSDRHREEAMRYLRPHLSDADAPEWDWSTFGEFRERIENVGTRLNIAPLVGHGSIRIAVKGFDASCPSQGEMAAMKTLLADAMEEGVFGMSTGLIYPPGSYSETPELVELASVMTPYGGLYSTHLRSEKACLVEAVDEAILIGRMNGIAVEISHHKAAGRSNWGKVHGTLRLMERARSEGVDVACDVYPYSASMTTITSLVPDVAMEGGVEAFLDRIRGGEGREEVWRGMRLLGTNADFATKDYPWWSILIARCPHQPEAAGRTLEEILGGEPSERPRAFLDWLVAVRADAMHVMLAAMCEEDVIAVMRSPFAAIASDGWFCSPERDGAPHPRSYGTFGRFLGRYVRDEKLLPFEEGIRKITSFPASRLGLTDRGVLLPGFWADLVVFDPEKIADRSTFTEAHQYTAGIEYVFVNGEAAFEKGEIVGGRRGRVLRRSS